MRIHYFCLTMILVRWKFKIPWNHRVVFFPLYFVMKMLKHTKKAEVILQQLPVNLRQLDSTINIYITCFTTYLSMQPSHFLFVFFLFDEFLNKLQTSVHLPESWGFMHKNDFQALKKKKKRFKTEILHWYHIRELWVAPLRWKEEWGPELLPWLFSTSLFVKCSSGFENQRSNLLLSLLSWEIWIHGC